MFEIWLLIFRGFWHLSVMVRRGITCEILGARCFLTAKAFNSAGVIQVS